MKRKRISAGGDNEKVNSLSQFAKRLDEMEQIHKNRAQQLLQDFTSDFALLRYHFDTI